MGPIPPKKMVKLGPKPTKMAINGLIDYLVAIHIKSLAFNAAKSSVLCLPDGYLIKIAKRSELVEFGPDIGGSGTVDRTLPNCVVTGALFIAQGTGGAVTMSIEVGGVGLNFEGNSEVTVGGDAEERFVSCTPVAAIAGTIATLTFDGGDWNCIMYGQLR